MLRPVPQFFLALAASCLAKPWRERIPLDPKLWRLGAAASGFLEALLSLVWYSYSVTTWAQHTIFSTMDAHPQAEIPPGTEGFAALALTALHPLTWVICYFGLEGAMRLLASFTTGTVVGSLPLYVLERAVRKLRIAPPEIPDELYWGTEGDWEILSVRSAKHKEGWEPQRRLRYDGKQFVIF